jgi:hypothetical protein
VIACQPLGSELAGGSRRLLVELTTSVAAGRLAVAVQSRPNGVVPRRLGLVLLS